MEEHRRRLLQEQQRAIEARRQQQQQEELARQRQKEAEERAEQQRIEQELMIQREKERQEHLRQQEEAARLAEEQRRREEAERLEKEKLMRIRDEQLRERRKNETVQKEMMTRMQHIGNPLTLISTHFLSDLKEMVPLPCENLAQSKLPVVYPHDEIDEALNRVDASAVSVIAECLSKVDVSDIRTRLDMYETENNDLPLSIMPAIIRNVIEMNSQAFDVEPEHEGEVDMITIQDAFVQDGPPRVLVQQQEKVKQAAAIKPVPTSYMTNEPSTSTDVGEAPKVQINIDSKEAAKLRKQMISMGKCPKASNQRKKRDMVESLYDSLTDYFDPTDGRRRRLRTRTLEDDQDDEESLKRDLELIAKMEAAEHKPGEEGTSGASDDEGKTPKKKKKEIERPPTPTEIIHQRDIEWNERQRKKLEKRRRRRIDEDQEYWNSDMMAENESYTKFSTLVDSVLDQVDDMDVWMASNGKSNEDEDGDDDDDVNQELLIERTTVDELRKEAQKLKSWRKLNKMPVDRLVKLIYMLERNMRDVISQDGSRLLVPTLFDEDGEEDEAALKELIGDRLIRACDAASAAMIIMTSYKMPKQVFIEDAIDRAINLCKHYLNNIVFPASDSVYKASASGRRAKAEDGRRKKKAGTNNRSKMIDEIYTRIADLMDCFAQLVRIQLLSETSLHHLATLAISSFFVNNVGVLQLQAMSLASNIFSIGDENIRISILTDILNSLHRLPPGKNTNNSYRLGHDQWISNTTVLVMQLVQSVVKMPKRKKHEEEDKNELTPDTIVKDSFREAQRQAGVFLQGFLGKCSCKGNKSEGEEDYRRIFDGFLQDLLLALYKPEWPAAEMILTVLGALLVKHYRAKSTDMTIRQASLDYLGSITARLRKDTKSAGEDSDKRMEIVVKTLIFEEQENDEETWNSVEDVDISHMSMTDRLKKLEQALIDYLIERKGDDVSVEYAVMFYAGEWYKETAEDMDLAKQQFKQEKKQEMSDKERRKLEKRIERMNEKGSAMKEFLIKLVDKKHMRKRSEALMRLGNVMMESDAAWAVKYLASRREFSHSFETYLRHILYGVTVEGTVGLRTRAMKCLTQIIEADHEVLGMADVRNAVNSRMMDPNAAVREATIELLGKFLLVKEEFIPTYYNILLERIKDSGTAVRKRVIRIMREICEKYPNFEKIPDMLSKLVRRVVDEDGVKKLVQDTFAGLWFQPCSDRHIEQLIKKVIQMTAVAQQCAVEQTIDFLEQLLQSLLKQGDKTLLVASRQIVDSLVDNVLVLETKMASDAGAASANFNGEDLSGAQIQKNNQDRLLACLTTLSIFSKVRPELMVKHAETLQPYLSMTLGTPAEQQVLNEVINMLERVVPLMNHPSDMFLSGLDESLSSLATNSGMVIVGSAISCASAVWHKFPRKQTSMAQKFLVFLKNLNVIKAQYGNELSKLPQGRMPYLQRAVYTLGLLARYFDFDGILEGDTEAMKSLVVVKLPPNPELAEIEHEEEDRPECRRYRDNVFALLEHFSRNANQAIRQKALTSIGHLCAQYSEYLARPEVKNMYISVMTVQQPDYLPLKIQALKNLEMFLLNEERKAIKSTAEWEKSKDHQNLKEMELSGSGLSSAVIQIYWTSVLNSYFSANETVRQAAVQVTCMTLNQGLVTPGSSIPALIAMTTDPVLTIRNKVENLLKEIDTKYGNMVQTKAIAGVRVAYQLNARIKPAGISIVRGIRACDASAMVSTRGRDSSGLPRMTNDGQAILSGLYSSLRGNRAHRRPFLSNILRLFSEDSREKLPLEERVFVADNIAMFPYQVLDEPLFAIRQIDNIISISGQTIVNQFKEQLIRPYNHPLEDDDVLFEPETLFGRFPEDKTQLYNLMLSSQACFILLYLKNFLMKLYGFTEAKVQEYSPSEAAKVYDKAVTRRNVPMFHAHSALEELKPEVIQERNTFQGDCNLARKICSFRKMLLSLDRNEDDDIDEGGETTGVTEREEDDDVDGGELTDTGMSSDTAIPMEE